MPEALSVKHLYVMVVVFLFVLPARADVILDVLYLLDEGNGVALSRICTERFFREQPDWINFVVAVFGSDRIRERMKSRFRKEGAHGNLQRLTQHIASEQKLQDLWMSRINRLHELQDYFKTDPHVEGPEKEAFIAIIKLGLFIGSANADEETDPIEGAKTVLSHLLLTRAERDELIRFARSHGNEEMVAYLRNESR